MVPVTGQASSLFEIFCMYDKRFEIKNKIEWRRKQNHSTLLMMTPLKMLQLISGRSC